MDYADYEIATRKPCGTEAEVSVLAQPMERAAPGRRQAVVAVIENGIWMSKELGAICEFLDITVVQVGSHDDLRSVLRKQTPMAVVCELDGVSQDGCHIMKTVADYDPTLPILLVTGDDPILIAAAEAVEEIWRLTEVTKPKAWPGIAGLVDFLFRAGRKGGCLRLMPART